MIGIIIIFFFFKGGKTYPGPHLDKTLGDIHDTHVGCIELI